MSAHMPESGAPATGALPAKVALARTLVLLLVAWLVVRAVITLVAGDAILDAYVDARADGSGDDAYRELVRDGAPAIGAIALISALLFGAALVLAALAFAKRATWARVLALVFAVLSVLGGLVGLFQEGIPFWYTATGLVNVVLGVGIVVTLLSGEARDWFRGRG